MGILSKFLASKWVTVLLILALAGGTYYVYQQGKLLGSAGEKADQYELDIAAQKLQIETLKEDLNKRQSVLAEQGKQLSVMRQSFGAARQRIAEAERNASKVLQECMAMSIADGMRFGPSTGTGADTDKARPKLDG